MKFILTLLLLILGNHSFGQIIQKIISQDSSIGNLNIKSAEKERYLEEIKISGANYHNYTSSYLFEEVDSISYQDNHNAILDSVFYINYQYKTCCGDPVFVDNEKLKIIASRNDSLFYIQIYDPENRII